MAVPSKRRSPPPPPPPPQLPFGPKLPFPHIIIRRKARRNYQLRPMLTWYFLTFMMRQKLQTRNQQPEETREEWVIWIKDKMEQVMRDAATTSWDKLCIYRVPLSFQKSDKNSYFPHTVSLGPYHHGDEHLRPMDYHKWRAVNMVMKRTKQGIEMYIDAMKELEERARACYEGPIGLSSNKFTQMLVLDGCFVLDLFRGAYEGFSKLGYDRNDPVFAMRGSMHSIRRDMLMLENQLPLMPTYMPSTKIENSQENNNKFFHPIADKDKEELHCLDVFRRSVLQPSLKPEPRLSRRWSWKPVVADKRQQKLLHCVTELREAGIKFKRRKSDRLWDIQFKNGCLEIPKLLIHDGTKSLLSNLIAFEQCHIDSTKQITSYIIFVENLINSNEDVRYLQYCGIIEHWLESDSEVVDLFHKLCQDVVFDPIDSYLYPLCLGVDRFYSRKWSLFSAVILHKYQLNLRSPWAYFSFFGAVILLLLTFCESFFTVYAYFEPNT